MNEQQKSKTGRQYLRKWKITIYKPAYKKAENRESGAQDQLERDPEHDIEMDVSHLRCIFKTEHKEGTAITLGTLVVYNMSAKTEKEVIESGFQISIFGGYEEAQYGEIFRGDILQIYRNREDGVDYRLEIIAMRGSRELYQNFVKSSVAAGSTPRALPKILSQNAKIKFEVGKVSENLTNQSLPRGKVLYSTPAKYLRNQSIAENATFMTEADGKVSVQKISDPIPKDMVLKLTPETGLVGTPVYGDDGIKIKMLLDARVTVKTMIKIDNDLIRRQAANFFGSAAGMPQSLVFDQDGEYEVFSVTHSGDTWGDDWTTEVVGVSRTGRAGLLASMKSSSQSMKG